MDKHSKIGQKKKRLKLNLYVIVEEIIHKHTHCTTRQNPPPTSNKQQEMRKQIQNNDDFVVNFTSLTSIVSNP